MLNGSFQFPVLKFLSLKLYETSYIMNKPVPLLGLLHTHLNKYVGEYKQENEEKSQSKVIPTLHISFHADGSS